MALSKLDPTGSQKWIDRYEKGILTLINNFEKRILKDFETAWTTGKIRSLEAGKLKPDKFFPHVDKVAEEEIIEPSKKVIKDVIPKAYQQGVVYGSVQLGAPLAERQIAWRKISEMVLQNEYQIKNMSYVGAQNIRRVVGEGIINERTQGQIIKDIQGVADKTRFEATRIIRTESMTAVNVGVKDRYRQSGVEVVEWLAIFEPGRTCTECADLDGRKFEIEEAPPCPKHPQCRCTLKPVVRPKKDDNIEKWKEPEKKPKEPKTPKEPAPKPVTPKKEPVKPTPLKEQTKQFAKDHKNDKVETVHVYKDGQLVGSATGSRNHVTLPEGNLKDTDLIHNHPPDANGDLHTGTLSKGDVIGAIKVDANSMTCTDPRAHGMTVYRPDKGWPTEEEATRIINKHVDDFNKSDKLNEFEKLIQTGKATPGEIDNEANHIILNGAFKEMGMGYRSW